MTLVPVFQNSLQYRKIGFIMPRCDDAIDMAILRLIIKIMHHLVLDIYDIPFAIHISLVSSHGFPPKTLIVTPGSCNIRTVENAVIPRTRPILR